jgi:hypothetical protein
VGRLATAGQLFHADPQSDGNRRVRRSSAVEFRYGGGGRDLDFGIGSRLRVVDWPPRWRKHTLKLQVEERRWNASGSHSTYSGQYSVNVRQPSARALNRCRDSRCAGWPIEGWGAGREETGAGVGAPS